MKLTIKALLLIILLNLFIVLFELRSSGQTTTVIPYDGHAVPVHLKWAAITPPTGWAVYDYCVAGSDTSGQEHATPGCSTHAAGTALDVFPGLEPGFYVVWAELKNAAGQIAMSADSNEASCDLEVLSSTPTLTTYYCKGQTQLAVPGKPTGLTATPR